MGAPPVAETGKAQRVQRSIADEAILMARKISGTANGMLVGLITRRSLGLKHEIVYIAE